MSAPLRLCAAIALLSAALASTGCAGRMVSANNPFAITAEEYDRVFEAAIDTLRLNQFVVDRQDRRFGVITTRPLVAGSALEPWRTDNTTAYQLADATLNYQRRIVHVYLEPADPEALVAAQAARVGVRRGEERVDPEVAAGDVEPAPEPVSPPADAGRYQLRTEVLLEQRQVPEQQLHTAAVRPATDYGRDADVLTTLTEEGLERSFWRPVGRDPYLEQRLIHEILTRATVVSPRFKSTGGPANDTAPVTPELIRPVPAAPQPDANPTPAP